ncbi:hypothetical protein SAMN05444158_5604 [Bradyrhizobium canariense]|uniref:Uncharacterized protein n=1 Tax=Bradyrhizobium canariense TaxID=255045 RepID=A0A1H1ZQG8_9BRAD|nr:hypothetical protein SAMN05444158_5604 [Bradyrhizobium canariense]
MSALVLGEAAAQTLPRHDQGSRVQRAADRDRCSHPLTNGFEMEGKQVRKKRGLANHHISVSEG